MTEDIPELPKFSRDISVLSGRLPNSERGTEVTDHGVLNPFSGVLDVRVERGRIPMLDLSYLTLEPLVNPNLARPVDDGSGSRSAAPAPDMGSSEPTAGDAESDGKNHVGEPTVREVIHGDRDAQPERYTSDLQRLTLQDEGPTRTRIDFGSKHWEHRSTRPSGPSHDADSSFEAPDLTAGEESELSERTRREGPSDSNRSNRTSTESTAFAPNQTVVDRSGPSFGQTDRVGDTSSVSGDPGSMGSYDIVPPRMVTGRADGDTGRVPDQSSRRDGMQSAEHGPDGSRAVGSGPRMVVEGSEDESTGESAAGSDETNAAPSRDGEGDAGGHAPSAHTVTRDEPIAAVIEASADPESRFVDRLYRALREREAIERRRGGR